MCAHVGAGLHLAVRALTMVHRTGAVDCRSPPSSSAVAARASLKLGCSKRCPSNTMMR